ncbi:pre-toxin TG domain-containing protein [Solibacillus cecembensis]|uniref:pre-toxin TG domain-containing protein n=1 Tax=Solibacillus cecembensis TaxID=459347 RepID=UPI003D00DF8E
MVEAAIRRDPITGKKLESWERGASFLAVAGGFLVKGVKHGAKLGAKAVSGAISSSKAKNKTVNLADSPTPKNPTKQQAPSLAEQQASATTLSPAKSKEQTKGTGKGTGLKSRKLSSEQIELDWLADKYTAVEVKGTVKVSGKEVDVSRRVYQIKMDKNYVPNNPKALGKSNRELMKKGNSPYIVKGGG